MQRHRLALRGIAAVLGAALALAMAGCATGRHASTQDPKPPQLIDQLPKVTPAPQGATGPSSVGLQMTGAGSFDDFLVAVIDDVAGFWREQFADWDTSYGTAPWQQVHYVILDAGQTAPSACVNQETEQYQQAGDQDDDPSLNSAFWCPQDLTVYVSAKWLYDHIWSPTAQTDVQGSDFGVAYAIAHEVGHAVQTELGIQLPELAQTVAPIELQADCLAGVWANAKYYQGVLDVGDVEEALAAARSVGDIEYSNPGHHGDSEQRASAFMVGYNNGDAGQCTLELEGAI
jgi:predicted metalloprotease